MRIKYLITLLAVLSLFWSCKKHAPDCSGNCVSIKSSGNVLNKLDGTGAAGVTVRLAWKESLWSQDLVIKEVKSGNDGSFDFSSDIDTSYFSKGYLLGLSVKESGEYIVLGYSGLISARTYSYDPNAFQNLNFEVFRKANLKLKLHRVQSDDFKSFIISHSNVVNDYFFYDYNVGSPQEVIDQNRYEINVKTVADVYTKIKVAKTLTNGTLITSIDSVKCTANSTVDFDVNF